MNIKHLSNKFIDKVKWDKKINEADNGLVYALSWYLDIVSPKWEALVSDDYEYIMPIPIKRKYKIPYLVQPSLSQQLGVFSAEPITKEIILLFIKKLPSYSYQINLNYLNILADAIKLPNYVLSVARPYEDIINGFTKNTVRNIEKANKNNLNIVEDISTEHFIRFYESINKKYNSIAIDSLKELINQGEKHNIFRKLFTLDENGNIIAALVYTLFKNRLVFLIPISNEEGKLKSAMFYVVNHIIKTKAESDILLDFEGSAIEGIARFYKGFGAKNQPYYVIKRFRPSFLIGRI
ncbi:hypothetical protein MASR2M117_06400 [Paludibacter sp.]